MRSLRSLRVAARSTLKGKVRRWKNAIGRRVRERDLRRALEEVGVSRGDLLCVHSSFGALGFVEGGAPTVIGALMDAVGGDDAGTVIMPTFSMRGSMSRFLDEAPEIDLRTWPSGVGRLTEEFRRSPGVVRSAHPTHSVAGRGRQAADILAGQDRIASPYADESPFGRMVAMENARLLLIHTQFLSILHHVQERIAFPYLYLPEPRHIRFIDAQGRTREITTRVMTPRLPYFLPLPGIADGYLHLVDYPTVIVTTRLRHLQGSRYCDNNLEGWKRAGESLFAGGICRKATVGNAELHLVRVPEFVASTSAHMQELVAARRSDYTPEVIEPMMKDYDRLQARR